MLTVEAEARTSSACRLSGVFMWLGKGSNIGHVLLIESDPVFEMDQDNMIQAVARGGDSAA